MPEDQSFAQRIKTRREELGLSQPELARRMSGRIDPQRISHYENGRYLTPRADTLLQFAHALEVDIEWLRDGLGQPRMSQLDRIERALADAGEQRADHAQGITGLLGRQSNILAGIEALLQRQSEVLERIEALVLSLGVPDGSTLQDHLAQLVRDTAVRSEAQRRPKRS